MSPVTVSCHSGRTTVYADMLVRQAANGPVSTICTWVCQMLAADACSADTQREAHGAAAKCEHSQAEELEP